jgi:glycosyltransferase involved in cell wall biosynthesis
MNPNLPLVACTGGLKLGGSTTFLVNLGWFFREIGVPFHVVSMEEQNDMAKDFTAANATIHVVPRRRTIYEDRIRLSYLAAAELRPSAVLSCLGSESFELLRIVPAGTVRIGIIQSDDAGPYQMARNYTPWLDAMVGVSEAICANLKRDSAFAGIRVEHIPYGISFPPLVPRLARDTSKPVRIIYIGRVIEEQKRISRVVELARILTARGKKFELTIAGGGPQLMTTKEALKHVEGVKFLGEVSNSEVVALLRTQDVFVLLSDYEGLPLSLLEAMGAGVVPVISDLQSGIRDVVNYTNGLKVPIGDVATAADAVISLAENPERLADLSAAASKSVRSDYSATRMGERYLHLVKCLTKPQAGWPEDVEIGAPMILKHPWLYQGLPRRVRRVLQRLRSL